jgi:hypothetical protein
MNILRTDIRVGKRHLLRQSIVGLQQIKQRQRGHPADGILPRQLEKLAFADFAVGIVVIIFEQLLRKSLAVNRVITLPPLLSAL